MAAQGRAASTSQILRLVILCLPASGVTPSTTPTCLMHDWLPRARLSACEGRRSSGPAPAELRTFQVAPGHWWLAVDARWGLTLKGAVARSSMVKEKCREKANCRSSERRLHTEPLHTPHIEAIPCLHGWSTPTPASYLQAHIERSTMANGEGESTFLGGSESYDAVVLGTGLKECIISGLLSVSGLKVRCAQQHGMGVQRALTGAASFCCSPVAQGVPPPASRRCCTLTATTTMVARRRRCS